MMMKFCHDNNYDGDDRKYDDDDDHLPSMKVLNLSSYSLSFAVYRKKKEKNRNSIKSSLMAGKVL